jgi:hypothetical protein
LKPSKEVLLQTSTGEDALIGEARWQRVLLPNDVEKPKILI